MLRKNESFIARVIAEMPYFAPGLRHARFTVYNNFAEALRKEDPAHFDEVAFRIASNMGEWGAPIVE